MQQPAPHEQEEHSRPQPESYSHLSKEIMTIKTQLLAVVNRLDYVEKNKLEIMKK